MFALDALALRGLAVWSLVSRPSLGLCAGCVEFALRRSPLLSEFGLQLVLGPERRA